MVEPVRQHFQHKCLHERGYVFEKISSELEQFGLASSSGSALGHFETNSDAFSITPIGPVLLQALTRWSASKVGAEARAPFHAAPIVVQFGPSPCTSLISKLRTAND
jgi:hypothetical protein